MLLSHGTESVKRHTGSEFRSDSKKGERRRSLARVHQDHELEVCKIAFSVERNIVVLEGLRSKSSYIADRTL